MVALGFQLPHRKSSHSHAEYAICSKARWLVQLCKYSTDEAAPQGPREPPEMCQKSRMSRESGLGVASGKKKAGDRVIEGPFGKVVFLYLST